MALIVQVLDDGVPLMEDLDPEGVPAGSFQEALGLLFEAATALALVKGSAASKTR